MRRYSDRGALTARIGCHPAGDIEPSAWLAITSNRFHLTYDIADIRFQPRRIDLGKSLSAHSPDYTVLAKVSIKELTISLAGHYIGCNDRAQTRVAKRVILLRYITVGHMSYGNPQ